MQAGCLRRQGVLSPVLLVRPGRGALTLICPRAHGGETVAESDVDAVPSIRGVDGRLSQRGPILWVGFNNFDTHIFWESPKEEAPSAGRSQVILGVFS